jgi:sigma-B regulation protein RsbU (phosphoserine phosphatase)
MEFKKVEQGAAQSAQDKLAGKTGKRPVVLYVEDEEINWALTEKRLRDAYFLTRAADARSTFVALQKQRFDLILLDIQLKGSELDGIQICRILRGKAGSAPVPAYTANVTSDAPIIFMTAYTARYNKAELLAAGGSELIIKPVDFTGLSLAMSRLALRNIKWV